RNRDSVKTGEMVAEENRNADKSDRQRGGMLANGEPGDDVGGVSGLRCLGDLADGSITCRRVIVRDQNDDASHEQSDERGEIEIASRPSDAANRDRGREK